MRTTTVPPPMLVPQTGQVLPNIPTINGAGPDGRETSQDRAVRCAHQSGVYGANAGNPSAYVDLPPLKWSSLMYVFDRGGYGDGKEEAYG